MPITRNVLLFAVLLVSTLIVVVATLALERYSLILQLTPRAIASPGSSRVIGKFHKDGATG